MAKDKRKSRKVSPIPRTAPRAGTKVLEVTPEETMLLRESVALNMREMQSRIAALPEHAHLALQSYVAAHRRLAALRAKLHGVVEE